MSASPPTDEVRLAARDAASFETLYLQGAPRRALTLCDGCPPAAPGHSSPLVTVEAAAAHETPAGTRLLAAGAIGALVAVSLGVYGHAHDPASDLSITLGFTDTITMKVWLASAAALLAVLQVLSALWLYGRLPLGHAPGWLGPAHRISGRLAFLVSLPVAYHCLYQLAFQSSSARVLVHSLAGCAFYGAFAAKVVIVRSRALPGAALPIAGGLLFTLLIVAWLTSGGWYVSQNGFPAP